MSQKFVEIQAVRIICDAVLKDRVLGDVIKAGATGYTWWDVHGKGQHDWGAEMDRVCVEAWCPPAIAAAVAVHFRQPAYRDIGLSVGIQTLLVPEESAGKLGAD